MALKTLILVSNKSKAIIKIDKYGALEKAEIICLVPSLDSIVLS
jgi:hypothetical protein